MTKTLDKAIAEMERARALTDAQQDLLAETVLLTLSHAREVGGMSLEDLSRSMSEDAPAKGLTPKEARRIISNG